MLVPFIFAHVDICYVRDRVCVRKSKIEFKNQDMEIFAKSASSTVPEFERVVREKIERDTNSYQNFRNRSKQGIAISYECI